MKGIAKRVKHIVHLWLLNEDEAVSLEMKNPFYEYEQQKPSEQSGVRLAALCNRDKMFSGLMGILVLLFAVAAIIFQNFSVYVTFLLFLLVVAPFLIRLDIKRRKRECDANEKYLLKGLLFGLFDRRYWG
jgi:hypothetical protein